MELIKAKKIIRMCRKNGINKSKSNYHKAQCANAMNKTKKTNHNVQCLNEINEM